MLAMDLMEDDYEGTDTSNFADPESEALNSGSAESERTLAKTAAPRTARNVDFAEVEKTVLGSDDKKMESVLRGEFEILHSATFPYCDFVRLIREGLEI